MTFVIKLDLQILALDIRSDQRLGMFKPSFFLVETSKNCTTIGYMVYILEMFYLNSTLNFGIPAALIFQLEVYYMVDRLQTGPTAQQKGTTNCSMVFK